MAEGQYYYPERLHQLDELARSIPTSYATVWSKGFSESICDSSDVSPLLVRQSE